MMDTEVMLFTVPFLSDSQIHHVDLSRASPNGDPSLLCLTIDK